MSSTLKIKSRKPTGQVPYPLLLVEGPEKAGKSLLPVVLSTSERVGMTYWIDLGEGAADEYAALPGAQYEVIEHDGSYRDILEQITAVYNEAARAAAAGEAPVVIVIDSMSAEWTMLVNWTNDRARRSKNGVRKLQADPDAEIDPTSNLWNDANKRHARIMDLLMSFPGIAIVTARGKEVAVIGPGGAPIEGRKEWKVEGQKNLAYDATAWIRLSRDPRGAELVGVRSLRMQVPEGQTLAMPMKKVGSWDVCDLETFIFETLGCTPGKAHVRDLQRLRGDELQGALEEVARLDEEAALKAFYDKAIVNLGPEDRDTFNVAVTARLAELRGPAPEGQPQVPQDGPTAPQEQPPVGQEALPEDPPAPANDADRLAAAAQRQEVPA
ncbi:hypothetical protein [Aeromicrobium sp. Leaf291]|uniref:hypothetical protein n=1 Tax=Aeromicrobium sp. Leaf291 TaxID=1736325 RepID=UPI0006F89413|nr:hypothetical protein [Aeromicrobium sp. Leaf291]KQP81557.1 hypothetical protein ASF35_16125 [Aeromicrobium sp. Leaf291]